jgi:hypothetical protein
MADIASIERNDVPNDFPVARAASARHELVGEIDADYRVFEGCTFKEDRFTSWLVRVGTPCGSVTRIKGCRIWLLAVTTETGLSFLRSSSNWTQSAE